jgi:hypothetical protein
MKAGGPFVVADLAINRGKFEGIYLGRRENGALVYAGKVENGFETERESLLSCCADSMEKGARGLRSLSGSAWQCIPNPREPLQPTTE